MGSKLETFLSNKLNQLKNCLVKIRFVRNHKNYSKLIKRNLRFKNMFDGKRCFVLGNGPSLNKIDFSLLKDEYTFTCNQLPNNSNFAKLKTNFHFWADRRFFDSNMEKEGNKELLETMLSVKTNDNSPEVFYDISAYEYNKKNNVNGCLKVNYFALANYDAFSFLRKREYDLSKIVPDFSTVVQTCICAAIFMGFKEIILLGCDCTSIINIIQSRIETSKVSEYGYQLSEAEQTRMKNVALSTSLAQEFRWQGKIFETYDYLYKYCSKKGIKLLNATDGSLLTSVPKVKLEDCLKK